jgi:hypothetical protein
VRTPRSTRTRLALAFGPAVAVRVAGRSFSYELPAVAVAAFAVE